MYFSKRAFVIPFQGAEDFKTKGSSKPEICHYPGSPNQIFAVKVSVKNNSEKKFSLKDTTNMFEGLYLIYPFNLFTILSCDHMLLLEMLY